MTDSVGTLRARAISQPLPEVSCCVVREPCTMRGQGWRGWVGETVSVGNGSGMTPKQGSAATGALHAPSGHAKRPAFVARALEYSDLVAHRVLLMKKAPVRG